MLLPILTNLVIQSELSNSSYFPFDLLNDCSVSSLRVSKGLVGFDKELLFNLVTVP